MVGSATMLLGWIIQGVDLRDRNSPIFGMAVVFTGPIDPDLRRLQPWSSAVNANAAHFANVIAKTHRFDPGSAVERRCYRWAGDHRPGQRQPSRRRDPARTPRQFTASR